MNRLRNGGAWVLALIGSALVWLARKIAAPRR